MKAKWFIALSSSILFYATGAQASAELAKPACGRCHALDKAKSGPSYKSMAEKFQGDEEAMLQAIKDPKIKHPRVRAKDENVKAIVKWIATLK